MDQLITTDSTADDHARTGASPSPAHMAAVLAGMTDGVMLLDREHRLMAWNERFAEFTGLPRHALAVGVPMERLLWHQAAAGEFGHMPDDAAIAAKVDELMRRVRAFRGTAIAERARPNGRVIEMRRTSLPDGGAVTLYTDITARKQAEAAERAAAELAAEAVRQRQQFVAMVTHELRVPLDAVLRSLALIEGGADAASRQALMASARLSGEALRALVDDILDFARLDSGQLMLRAIDFSPAQTLAEVCDMFRQQSIDSAKPLLLTIDAGVPRRAHGDAGRIRQVVTNLLSNALKYAQPGPVELRAAATGQMVRISVVDAGPAIPPAQAANLFRPFTRLAAADAGDQKGTGLGLAICARLVELMGGEIGISREGNGNSFWFAIQLAPADGGNRALQTQATRPRGRAATLLLVEDIASNRELSAAMLRREGYRVDVAVNGFAALDRLAAAPCDLVLMDVHMPGIDGYETARRIRAMRGPAGALPIVAISGTSAAGMQVPRESGLFNAALLKPTRPEELLATLRGLLSPWSLPDRPAPAVPARATSPSVIDGLRIAALREGLAAGMFDRLLRQCLADIHEHLGRLRPDLPLPAIMEGAHAVAGMAGSYGLVGLEQLMRAIMASRADDAHARALLADAPAALAACETALRDQLPGF